MSDKLALGMFKITSAALAISCAMMVAACVKYKSKVDTLTKQIKEVHRPSLDELIDAMPSTHYKANLLCARGAERSMSSEELGAVLLPWARRQVERLKGAQLGDL
jgi:hypothetical protein